MLQAARITTVALLVLSLGLHWGLLQSLAWAGMIIRYSREAPLQEAVEKTFDGKHPCKMCLLVKEGREAEKQRDPKQAKPTPKLDLGLVWQAPALYVRCLREWVPPSEAVALRRSEAPPRPPPRLRLHSPLV